MSESKRPSYAEELSSRMAELTLARIGPEALENARRNQSEVVVGRSILELPGSLGPDADSAALVIAAGPSIHRVDTVAMIRESGFKGLKIATESSMAWCLRNGIVPDVVVTVDPHPDRIVRWFGDPELTQEHIDRDDYYSRQEMDPEFCREQLRVNAQLIDLVNRHGPRIKIAMSTSASQAVVRRAKEAGMEIFWWNPFYDDPALPDSVTRQAYTLNRLPCINAGGNVGTACWVLAHAILGKSRIGLLGVDFGYYDDTTYRQTQYYTEIKELAGDEEGVAAFFSHIHNPYVRRDFFTDPAYLWYRDIFLEMAEEAQIAGVKTYNCTGGGILFGPGIIFADLKTFGTDIQ